MSKKKKNPPQNKTKQNPTTTQQKSIEALSLEVNKLCFDKRRKYLTSKM